MRRREDNLMAESSLEEVFRELEDSIDNVIYRIRQLQEENEELRQQILVLQKERQEAAERINIVLDRMRSLR